MIVALVCLLPSAVAVPGGTEQVVMHSSDIVRGRNSTHNQASVQTDSFGKNETSYDVVSYPSFVDHQLRVTQPNLCDTVKQYSGYLDITDGNHIFFWFFESRSSPTEDPLVLWLNGGPGCSSIVGLLFEHGPCLIADEGNNTRHNLHSWNKNANIIYLDQPVGSGFSYSSDGSSTTTSPDAAKDVYAFLQHFMHRFPKYSKLPFHIAGESYGGRYIPHIATEIHRHNKELAKQPSLELIPIHLASVMIGNGLVDPLTQMPSVVEYACEGPYAIYDDPFGAECRALRAAVPVCKRMIEACYKFESPLTCVPATGYCWQGIFGPIFSGSTFDPPIMGSTLKLYFLGHGYNYYDARKKCSEKEDGSVCYKEVQWVEKWLNVAEHKVALGVDAGFEFASCNILLNLKFNYLHGDGMKNGAALLPELIASGIRLLIYAGNTDLMCNFMGETQFVSGLDSMFHDEFLAAPTIPWSVNDTIVGEIRSAGGGGLTAGNLTLAVIFEAGHMAPYDQPAATLDMMTKWINDVPIA
ncbi:peptidase S10 serine carboxypeptidase [Rhizopogon vinicolor AM-OR11-026]|uniref:Carboxypeptidase n=1 Tax=Rhizopogon vinicolor AM-OR11-026 TaxID=1314800 RepID=A0A1B7MYL5_9AGAM|nr:peptidase S10 serine carboxypeptidase [Rhizopogon vinicolor AM-OR11-026]